MNGRDWRELYRLPLDDDRKLRRYFPYSVAQLKTALEVFGWISMTHHQVTPGLIALTGCMAQVLDVLLPVTASKARAKRKLHFHIMIDHFTQRLTESETPLELEEEGAFERALRAHEKNSMKAGGSAGGLLEMATSMELREQVADLYTRHKQTPSKTRGTGTTLPACGTVWFMPCAVSDERDVRSMTRRIVNEVVTFPQESHWRVAPVTSDKGVAAAMVVVQSGVHGDRKGTQFVCKCPALPRSWATCSATGCARARR